MANITLIQAAKNLTALKRRLPVVVGAVIIDFVLDNFDKQGFDTGGAVKAWEQRRNDTRPGGAILVGKQGGRLKRSIRQLRKTRDAVEVGSDVPYAKIHNEGGEIKVPVTAKSRRFFWAMYYETGQDYWKGMALTEKTTLTINMPERRFVGPSAELDERVARAVVREFSKAFN